MRPILLIMWTAFQSFILRDNNKDFYSAISVGSWGFTTEYFKPKILKIKKFTSIIKHKCIKIQVKKFLCKS